MGWATGVVIYVILWWMVFFMILPIGNRTADEVGEEVGPGHAASAPVRPRLWIKAGATTLVTALVWIGVYYFIQADMASFRQG
jgi:predicted secreted protein